VSTLRPVTRTERVHAELRHEIIRGQHEPGARLRVVELSDRFSVSQSVIREALTRLAEQKLVVALPQQGFRVITFTPESLRDLTEARVTLEPLVARLAVERGDVAWESTVVAAHHRLSRTSAEPELDGTLSEKWFIAHEAFHKLLLEGSGNVWLTDLATTLRAAAAVHRRWAASVAHDNERDLTSEHRELLEAALARDAHRLSEALTKHIGRTSSSLAHSKAIEPSDLSSG
jgi:DNA-binding GntR family transcriptional regulator